MTPYVLEMLLTVAAIGGTTLVITETVRLRRWWSLMFYGLFGLAPVWFAMAHFRLLAWGDPGWLLNRWLSFGVRVPLVLALYVLWFGLRRQPTPPTGGWRG